MKILFFDTETTGFPKKDLADPTNPHIIQLAWALYHNEGAHASFECFKKSESLVKPDGWEIPTIDYWLKKGKTMEEIKTKKLDFWSNNGFSMEKSNKEGRPIAQLMKHFMEASEEADYIVAHNLDFDKKLMIIEMLRLKVSLVKKPDPICTMQHSTNICKLPGKYGTFKWPTLTELHVYLFQKPFDGAHDALADVVACADCFFELKKRNLLTLIPKNETSSGSTTGV